LEDYNALDRKRFFFHRKVDFMEFERQLVYIELLLDYFVSGY